MYRIVLSDGTVLYNTNDVDNYTVIEPRVTLEIGQAGSLQFSILPSNSAYDRIKGMETFISAYRDDVEIFYGRVIDVNVNELTKQKEVQCAGALSFLEDGELSPFGQQTAETLTASEFFARCISDYNSDIGNDSKRTFTVGTISHSQSSSTKAYQISSHTNAKSALETNIINEYGGYLRTRRSGGVNYIDWIESFGESNASPVTIGSNVAAQDNAVSSNNFCTVIRPVGKNNLTLSGGGTVEVASGLIAKYGRIVKSVNFSGAENEQTLSAEASAYILQLAKSLGNTCTVKVVDMHFVDPSVAYIKMGAVYTNLSGFEGESMTAAGAELDMANPANDTVTFKNAAELVPSARSTGNSNAGRGSFAKSSGSQFKNIWNHISEDEKTLTIHAEQINLNAYNINENAQEFDRFSLDANTRLGRLEGTGIIQNSSQIAQAAGSFTIKYVRVPDERLDAMKHSNPEQNPHEAWFYELYSSEYTQEDADMHVVVYDSRNSATFGQPVQAPEVGRTYWRAKVTEDTTVQVRVPDPSFDDSSEYKPYYTRGLHVSDGTGLVIDQDGHKVNVVDEILGQRKENGILFEEIKGSALWTQRDNITGLVGKFTIITDPQTGEQTLHLEEGTGLVITENGHEVSVVDKIVEVGEGFETIQGSALWTQRDNITGIVGKFTTKVDEDGVERVYLEEGTGLVINESGHQVSVVEGLIAAEDAADGVAQILGSALWTQRSNITGVVGRFHTEEGEDGAEHLVIDSGGGMIIKENNVEYGLYHDGNLTGGIVVDLINDNTTETQIRGDRVKIGDTTDANTWAENLDITLEDYYGMIVDRALINDLNAVSARVGTIEGDYLTVDKIANMSVVNMRSVSISDNPGSGYLSCDGYVYADNFVIGANSSSAAPTNKYVSNAIQSVQVIQDPENADQYILQYQKFSDSSDTWHDAGNFNRAASEETTLTASWGGSNPESLQLDVVASPQNKHLYLNFTTGTRQNLDGSDYTEGNTWYVPVKAYPNGTNPQYTTFTRVFVDASDIYEKGVEYGSSQTPTDPTTLTAEWSGPADNRKVVIRANPQTDATYTLNFTTGSKQNQDGTAYTSGNTWYVPVKAYPNGTNPQYETFTRVFVDAGDIYEQGVEDGKAVTRNTTLTVTWEGSGEDKHAVIKASNPADPTDENYTMYFTTGAKQNEDGSAYTTGNSWYVPVSAYRSGVTPVVYTQFTRIFVDANDIYQKGYNQVRNTTLSVEWKGTGDGKYVAIKASNPADTTDKNYTMRFTTGGKQNLDGSAYTTGNSWYVPVSAYQSGVTPAVYTQFTRVFVDASDIYEQGVEDGKAVTRNTTLTVTWEGSGEDKHAVIKASNPADPTDENYTMYFTTGAKQNQDGSAYTSGNMWYVPVKAYKSGQTPAVYTQFTRVFVDASDVYAAGAGSVTPTLRSSVNSSGLITVASTPAATANLKISLAATASTTYGAHDMDLVIQRNGAISKKTDTTAAYINFPIKISVLNQDGSLTTRYTTVLTSNSLNTDVLQGIEVEQASGTKTYTTTDTTNYAGLKSVTVTVPKPTLRSSINTSGLITVASTPAAEANLKISLAATASTTYGAHDMDLQISRNGNVSKKTDTTAAYIQFPIKVSVLTEDGYVTKYTKTLTSNSIATDCLEALTVTQSSGTKTYTTSDPNTYAGLKNVKVTVPAPKLSASTSNTGLITVTSTPDPEKDYTISLDASTTTTYGAHSLDLAIVRNGDCTKASGMAINFPLRVRRLNSDGSFTTRYTKSLASNSLASLLEVREVNQANGTTQTYTTSDSGTYIGLQKITVTTPAPPSAPTVNNIDIPTSMVQVSTSRPAAATENDPIHLSTIGSYIRNYSRSNVYFRVDVIDSNGAYLKKKWYYITTAN